MLIIIKLLVRKFFHYRNLLKLLLSINSLLQAKLTVERRTSGNST